MRTERSHEAGSCERSGAIPVILVRHAESEWNRENRFTGWANPALTEAGILEAIQAGQLLRDNRFQFDVAYSSRLTRSIVTLDILLDRIGQTELPRQADWRLNERHYGALQGINKADAAERVGKHQVWRWRRGYLDFAAPMSRTDPAHPLKDPLYADIDPRLLPDVENLARTRERVMAFWAEKVVPHIRRGERVLISSHGNTLRALLMDLAGMSVEEVEDFEIPTARPIRYDFDTNGNALDWRYLNTNVDLARTA